MLVTETLHAFLDSAAVYDERSTADTYVQAAIRLLLDAEDLVLLAHAEELVFQTVPGLPPWVPDWGSAHVVGLGVTNYRMFSAAGDQKKILQIDEERRTSIVSGIRIGTAASTAESKQEVLKGKPFLRLLDKLFWRTLFTDTGGPHTRTLGSGTLWYGVLVLV